ncbi:MAG: tetratricopeptide repeat protein [Candidatus Xenobia bacterium]
MSDTIQYQGQTWRWNGKHWADARNGQIPPLALARRLDAAGADIIQIGDARLRKVQDKISAARIARQAGQLQRAERLVREVLELYPTNPAALAVLCSLLRMKGHPEQALAITDVFQDSPTLVTSRAAALADLGRNAEAARVIEAGTQRRLLSARGPIRRRLFRKR